MAYNNTRATKRAGRRSADPEKIPHWQVQAMTRGFLRQCGRLEDVVEQDVARGILEGVSTENTNYISVHEARGMALAQMLQFLATEKIEDENRRYLFADPEEILAGFGIVHIEGMGAAIAGAGQIVEGMGEAASGVPILGSVYETLGGYAGDVTEALGGWLGDADVGTYQTGQFDPDSNPFQFKR